MSVVTSSGIVYESVDAFIASLPSSEAIRRYMRRYERVPRKFWERGGRRPR